MQGPYSVFATIGNARDPFPRFLEIVDEATRRAGLSALIQCGNTAYTPVHAEAIDFVSRTQFEELMRQAQFVVTHAGVGSVMTALRSGKVPIVVTRRKAAGEMVNDHQLQLAAELSSRGWCRVVDDVEELLKCFQNAPAPLPDVKHLSNQEMLDQVAQFIR